MKVKVFDIWCGVYVGDGNYEGGSWDDTEFQINDSFSELSPESQQEYITFLLNLQYEESNDCTPDIWEFEYEYEITLP